MRRYKESKKESDMKERERERKVRPTSAPRGRVYSFFFFFFSQFFKKAVQFETSGRVRLPLFRPGNKRTKKAEKNYDAAKYPTLKIPSFEMCFLKLSVTFGVFSFGVFHR